MGYGPSHIKTRASILTTYLHGLSNSEPDADLEFAVREQQFLTASENQVSQRAHVKSRVSPDETDVNPPHPPMSTTSTLFRMIEGGGPTQQSRSAESPTKKTKKLKWTANEDALMIRLRGDDMMGEDISRRLPGRSAVSCRLRYQNYIERNSQWDDFCINGRWIVSTHWHGPRVHFRPLSCHTRVLFIILPSCITSPPTVKRHSHFPAHLVLAAVLGLASLTPRSTLSSGAGLGQ